MCPYRMSRCGGWLVFGKKTVFNIALLLDSYYAGGFGRQKIVLLVKTGKSYFSTMKYY
jgi:hypothetical protein